jgi:hypothetical protein
MAATIATPIHTIANNCGDNMPISEDLIQKQFRILVAAALKGERCPQRKPYGPLDTSAVTEMYRLGWIKGEIYAFNWRRITIMVGPHAGKTTASFPGAGKPYRTIGMVPAPQSRRPGPAAPSAPRPLTAEELER